MVSRLAGKKEAISIWRELFPKANKWTIPNHKEIDRGTLHNIFKKLLPFIPEAELKRFFYTGN